MARLAMLCAPCHKDIRRLCAKRAAGPHRFVRVYRVRENCFAHRRKLRVPRSAVFILSTNLHSANSGTVTQQLSCDAQTERKQLRNSEPRLVDVCTVMLRRRPGIRRRGDRSAGNKLCGTPGRWRHPGDNMMGLRFHCCYGTHNGQNSWRWIASLDEIHRVHKFLCVSTVANAHHDVIWSCTP